MRYVVGLAFSEDRNHLVMIEKQRPTWQAGLLNGVGGKIELGELPLAAMVREFREETGVHIAADRWQALAELRGSDFELFFYTVATDDVHDVQSITDERVVKVDPWLIHAMETVSNIPVMVALALDDSGIAKPLIMIDEKPEAKKAAA
jgi:8-oxo-dGTP diphosphatase